MTAQQIPRNYAFVTRTLLDLFYSDMLPNVTMVEAEPKWGHVSRIRYKNGSVRMTYGNDIGLNSGAAADVARDKAYTKMFLEHMEIETPHGDTFLFPWWLDQMSAVRRPDHIPMIADAPAYARDQLGFPVYAKQVDGSKGKGVSLCESTEDVEEAIATLTKLNSKVMLVEEAVEMPDCRLVLLNGDLISAYLRTPLGVVGDGIRTVRQLLADRQVAFDAAGRDTQIDVNDPRIAKSLRRRGLSIESVPNPGEQLRVHDVSNLSLGGTAEDITDSVAARWQELCREIAAGLNLAFCGIDLFCTDLTDPLAEYRVLEVNAAPGLDHYASVGPKQQEIVRGLYAKVLDVPPPLLVHQKSCRP